MTRIWIYGFEPFRAYRKNITQEILRHLPERPGLTAQVLPVRFERELFLAPLEELQPDWVLGLGQCPRGHLLRLERRAYNQMRERRSDSGQPIDPTQPDWLSLDWKLPVSSDTRVSYDAGRYVCNFSMFQVGLYAQQKGIPSAFVHIPKDYPLNRALNWLERVLNLI